MNRLLIAAVLLIAGLLSGTAVLYAQPIHGFSYQAIARDNTGALITNGSVDLSFEVYQGEPGNAPSFVDAFNFQNQPTNALGLISLIIGKDDPSFAAIDWSLGPHFVIVEIDGVPVDTMPFTSVPYSEISRRALEDEVDDADADPTNELQGLSLSGDTLMISTGGSGSVILPAGTVYTGGSGINIVGGVISNAGDADADPTNELQNWANLPGIPAGFGDNVDDVDDADANPTNEAQTLSKSGNTVSLSTVNGTGGGSFTDAVNDADADPTNEIQTLTFSSASNALSISGTGGNSVDLSALDNPSPWSVSGSDVYRSSGEVGIGTSNPEATLDVRGGANIRNRIRLKDNAGQDRIALDVASSGYAQEDLRGENGGLNVRLGAVSTTSDGRNRGQMSVFNESGNTRAVIRSHPTELGVGEIVTFGTNNSANVSLGVDASNTAGRSRGAIRIWDENGNIGVRLGVDVLGRGTITAYGTGGLPNPGGIKNFRMPHPTRADKDIVYACIEGPEAAAYERGTVQLVNGEAEVTFSEHFEIVANPTTMTILTSPWSADSKGLAVVERTATGFKIKELHGGTGNYNVDWEVKAVRKGWEDYQPIRDREQENAPNPTPNE